MEVENQLTYLGFILIVLGVFLVFLPFITRFIPDVDKIPWLILWVYKTDGFTFVASPLLILISLVSIFLYYFKH